jgi:hypothetical protein
MTKNTGSTSIPTNSTPILKNRLKSELGTNLTTNEVAKSGIDFIFDTFRYKLHTFQFLGKAGSSCKVYKDTERAKALEDSVSLNKQGYDVFFMVNEGDGIIYEGKKIPRSQENVQQISWCYMDTDTCPIAQVSEYLKSLNLSATIEIESSPGRFHLYFQIEPFPPFEAEQLQKWESVQSTMCRLGDPTSKPLTDPSMVDYARILRVPCFQHIKKECLVSLWAQTIPNPLLTIDFIYDLTNAQDFEQLAASSTFELSQYLSPESQVPVGERFPAVRAFSMHIVNKHADKQEALNAFGQFVANKLIHTDQEYLTKDRRLTAKSMSLFNSAWDVRAREQRTNIQVLNAQAEDLEENVTQHSVTNSPWHLPDEFYTSAPNGFGDVVTQVLSDSRLPRPSIAFGTFLAGLSILKAKKYRTLGGQSPALFILNVAPSGYGKGAPYTILQNTLKSNGFSSLVINEIRSDRGLANHLGSTDGRALLLCDEIFTFLKTIQQEDAASYKANIMRQFLHIFSSGSVQGFSFGKIGQTGKKKQEIEIVIDCPSLAICGYLVPEDFNKLFTQTSVARGLYSRFIPIVTEPKRIVINTEANANILIKSELFQSIIQDTAEELDQEGNPVPDPLSKTVSFMKMDYTEDARKRFIEFEATYYDRMESCLHDPETTYMSAIYARVAEQAERVATTLALDVIDLTTLEYAIKFIESRHHALIASTGATNLSSAGQQKRFLIIDTTQRLCSTKNVEYASKRDVFRSLERHFDTVAELDRYLADCVQLGEVELKTVRNPRPSTHLKVLKS